MKRGIYIFLLICISCAEKYKKPRYISYQIKQDSIYVILQNSIRSKTFLKVEDIQKATTQYVDFNTSDTITVGKFSKFKIDTNQINKNFRFKLFYGTSSLKRYDTFYNYSLPFSKGKRYPILQGNNGSFSHQKTSSKYAIDFTMHIGQAICAVRDGVVVKVKNDSDVGGRSKKYYDKANFIFIGHSDGTYANYAHLKKNGAIVKEGDSIKKGQIIGYSGNTGFSTRPHLHFIIYKPTKDGLVSIPYILDSIPSKRYVKGKYAYNK